MSHPLVVHRSQKHDVYIGRPSKWGNPFQIGPDGDRAQVITKYRAWIKSQPDLLADLPELRGKILGCWCAPKACHGDVLAQLANRPLDDPLDKQILRQITEGLTVAEIDNATDAQLFCELERLLLTGGNIRVDLDEEAAPAHAPEITFFTCLTQHIIDTDFRLAIKRALIQEMFRSQVPFPRSSMDHGTWMNEHRVPDHLR